MAQDRAKIGQVTAQNFNIKNKTGAAAFDAAGKVLTLGNLPTKFLQFQTITLKTQNLDQRFTQELFQMEWKSNKNLLKSRSCRLYCW